MKVVLHPADTGGCGHYRMIFPGETLAAQGYDVEVKLDCFYDCIWQDTLAGPEVVGIADPIRVRQIGSRMKAAYRQAQRRGATGLELERILSACRREVEAAIDETGHAQIDADVVVFQRPLSRNRVEFIRAIQRSGVAVVVEVDDDFHAIHRLNPAWRDSDPARDPDKNRDHLMRACQIADLVTVTTPALAARYAPHGRVAVLPNYVPSAYTQTIPEPLEGPGRVVVGWSGWVGTHRGDLNVCGDGIARVLDARTGFQVVGSNVKVAEALGLSEPPPATGWLPIGDYPAALARLDVGIVPLKAVAFNDAKSCLKGLEMAAGGVPFVASPVADYRRLHGDGIGWLADSPDEWASQVGRLARDEQLRAGLAVEWQAAIAERYTIEGNAWRWLEAWEQARVNRAERRAA